MLFRSARLAEVWPDLQIVAEARNGLEAVALVAEHRPELVFLDIRMPGLSGVELTQRLRQLPAPRRAATPVIALTANAINGEREKCLAAGMNDYLTKPFKEVTLIKMVHDWVVGEK